jgi:hypothetical protein
MLYAVSSFKKKLSLVLVGRATSKQGYARVRFKADVKRNYVRNVLLVVITNS